MQRSIFCLFFLSRREAEAAAMAAAVEKQKVTDRYMNSPRDGDGGARRTI